MVYDHTAQQKKSNFDCSQSSVSRATKWIEVLAVWRVQGAVEEAGKWPSTRVSILLIRLYQCINCGTRTEVSDTMGIYLNVPTPGNE